MLEHLDFSQEDVARAARYHQPLYLAFVASVGISFAVYSILAWGGDRLWSLVDGLGWAGSAAAWAAIVVAVSQLVRLPLAYWRDHLRESRWGFSTQSLGGWLSDRAKGLALSLFLTAAAWVVAVGLVRLFPRWWPAAAAGALALAILFLSFVAPVVLEPIFNRFRPLDDEELAAELHALAERAGVPVRDILVADASRRTTKVNAYVSGLGATRRVVLFDTLLASAGRPEVRLIVAHELGHRRDRHVAKGTLLATAGAVPGVLLVWAVLGDLEPRDLPLVLLLILGLELVGLPFFSALSRRWERAADRCSLELTEDMDAFRHAHVDLALKNLSDLQPPRPAYLFLFTHPTPPERLALARQWREG